MTRPSLFAVPVGFALAVAALAPVIEARQAAPQPCRIFITEEDPPTRLYTLVRKDISATKKFYGSHDDELIWQVADLADKYGADAIVKFEEKRAVTMFSWASARVSGIAVKWTAAGRTAMRSMRGNCWNIKTRKIQ